MRFRSKKPRHMGNEKNKDISLNKEAISEGLKKAEEKINKGFENVKGSAAALNGSIKKSKFNKEYLIFGGGAVFFFITAILSVNFAMHSNINTAINTEYDALDSDLIYNGVYIEEVNIGGLNKEQAIRKGNTDYAGRRLKRAFTLEYNTYSKDVTYEDLGGTYDIKSIVNEAYKIGRTGSKAERLAYADNLEDVNEYLVADFSVDKKKMKETVEAVADEVNGSVITDGEMDVERTMEMLEENMLINSEDISIYIPTK